MNIKLNGVYHVMVTVGDLDVAKKFYGGVLGLEEADCPVKDGQRVWYKIGKQELHVNLQRQHYKAGFGHFAISVEPEKYHDYVERIRSTGYERMNESQKYIDGLHRLFIDDPFGNTIEITDGQLDA
jgi:catechol 2,3-dioxygenase-like lactoylglutathione lyase family enzyme